MKNTEILFETESKEAESYFYGANTKSGFILTPDGLIGESGCNIKVYIKGGPGTGKSALIRRFAARAEELGYGVTYYYCSFDPSSLDSAVAQKGDKRICVCDATEPHAADPEYPGAVSFTFDVSEFFDVGALRLYRDEIFVHTARKKDSFDRAYACLHAAGEVMSALDSLLDGCTDTEKLEKFATRTASRYKAEGGVRKVIVSAHTMSGAVRLDTLRRKAERVYSVTDTLGISRAVIPALYRAFAARGVGCDVAISPLDGSVDAIFIRDEKVLYTKDPGASVINGERFAVRDAGSRRARIRFFKKCVASLTGEALKCLSSASPYHFELEKIFSKNVDFVSSTEAFDKRVISLL